MHLLQCHTCVGISLSLILEVRGVGLEKENGSDPLDSIPPSVSAMQCEGNGFVLVTTKEDVIYLFISLFARYKPVPFIKLPISSHPRL